MHELRASSPAVCAFLAIVVLASDVGAEVSRDQAWREDLQTYATKLRKLHPKPFAHVSEARFDSAYRALEGQIPRLNDAQVAVGLMRLNAMIQDGHTLVVPISRAMGFGQVVPVRLCAFEDGLAISATGPSLLPYLGATVLRVGWVPAKEALRRAVEVTPADNEMTQLDRAAFFLTMPPMLQALGIVTDGGQVPFEVRTPAGRIQRFTARAVPDTTGSFDWYFEGESLPIPGARTAHDATRAPLPLHLRDPARAWWFDWDPQARLLYVQLRRVQFADRDRTFPDFVRGVFALSDSVRPETFVLDLRHNHGGNNQILKPLIHGLIQRESTINRRGHLFTIIGRGTFSAAQNCANWLEEHTQTMFVGEPTGGRPNHYGDNEPMALPHHQDVLVFVSRWLWQAALPWDDRPWIAPHIAAPMKIADYVENRDPALEAILAYQREPTLTEVLREKVQAGGRPAVASAYRDFVRRAPDRWGRTHESELNQLGYALLGEGRAADAAAILSLNTEHYPGSANAWDSLAEATAAAGDTTRAVEYYRKALELDPNLPSARRALERLHAN